MPTPPISRLIVISLMVAAPAAPSSFAAGQSAALDSTEVNVVEAPDPRIPEVRIRLVLYSGSAADHQDREGLAWLTAAAVRLQAGAGVEVAAGKDMTVFTAAVPREGAPALIDALSRALVKPAFDTLDLDRIRADQKLAIESSRAEAGSLLREAFDWFVYRGHPYGHPAPGREASVDRITRDDLLAFHAEHYRKGNLAVGLHGAVDADLIARVKEDLVDLPDGTPGRPDRPVTFLPRQRVLIVEMEGALTSHLLAGHPLNVTRAHPDYPSVAVALFGLQGAQEAAAPRRRRTLAIAVEAEPADVGAAIQRIVAGLTSLVSGGIDGGRLVELKRSMLREQTAAMSETQGSLESRLGDYLDRTPGYAERLPASIEEVSVESVRSALSRHLFPERLAVVVVAADAGDLLRRLLAGTEDPARQAPAGRFGREDIEIVKARDLFR